MDNCSLQNLDSNPTFKKKPSFTSILTPLLEEQDHQQDQPLFPPTPTVKDQIIFGSSNCPSTSNPPPNSPIQTNPQKPKTNLHRSRTAPAMSSITDILSSSSSTSNTLNSASGIVRNAFVFFSIYLSFGVLIYTFFPSQFSSSDTHPVVDALYFSIVTMCTIGYGDITPLTPLAKLFSIAFVLVGFGFIDVLLSGMVSYVLDVQENLLLSAAISRNFPNSGSYLVDVKKGRMRIRMKVALALAVVVFCVGVGTGFLHFIERLGWLDSFYLSVMSVTTVGYGDHAFSTLVGRLFASIWLLVSTLAVARAFLYLAEARIDRRHRRIAKWVLGRNMTVAEFLLADINHNGYVSKSEFVVYKLKEMGKVSEKDISQICVQFDKLDSRNFGKIRLVDLTEGKSDSKSSHHAKI